MPDHTPIPESTLRFDVLLRWERAELEGWTRYFLAHPEALALPFAQAPGADPRFATVRTVVHHVATVERRYVDRLAGDPVTAYDALPRTPDAALLDAARDANARLAAWVARATPADYARVHEFETISYGTLRGSARKVVAHALLHGVRTWAQIATVVRMAGIPTGWPHDLLLSDALD